MTTWPVPRWIEEIRNPFFAGNAHQFLLDGNVHDSFFWPSDREDDEWSKQGTAGDVIPFRDFLVRTLLRWNAAVLYYSPVAGIRVLLAGDGNPSIAGPREERSGDFSDAKAFGEALKGIDPPEGAPANSVAVRDRVLEHLLRIEGALRGRWKGMGSKDGKRLFIATVVDGVERFLADTPDSFDRHLLDRIERVGLDPTVKEARNLSVLITENREMLPRALQSGGSGTIPVEVASPDGSYRELFFQQEKEQGLPDSPLANYLKGGDDRIATIVQLTRGFRLVDCLKIRNAAESTRKDDMGKRMEAFFFGPDGPDGPDIERFVRQEKKDVISSSSRGMLEPVESRIRFADIGGLEGAKDYFRKVSHALIEKDRNPRMVEIVPKGVLLAGPPGTGKTLLAKALATESGVSLVKMGDIRSMWVGESERNLTMVLRLLKSMAPVIVFIDEVDQAIGSRSAGSGDSGVSGRMFGKILEFMGDNANRGDVIWVAATNRADLLDDAMIRRFDRVIPILLPGSAGEWLSVLEGIARQMSARAEKGALEEFVGRNIERLRGNHSGSSIEMVMRFAFQGMIQEGKQALSLEALQRALDNFKTNFKTAVYEFQTVLSIHACNETGFITPPSEKYSYGFKDLDEDVALAIEKRSNVPLEERLTRLRARLVE